MVINKHFSIIADKIVDILTRKNHDYDNAFEKSVSKYGWVPFFIKIEDKINRLQSLTIKNNDVFVQDESVEDTLIDICGYCMLMLSILNERKGEK